MCKQKDSDSGMDRFDRRPNSPPLRASTIRYASLVRSRCETKTVASSSWSATRSSTDLVASANER